MSVKALCMSGLGIALVNYNWGGSVWCGRGAQFGPGQEMLEAQAEIQKGDGPRAGHWALGCLQCGHLANNHCRGGFFMVKSLDPLPASQLPIAPLKLTLANLIFLSTPHYSPGRQITASFLEGHFHQFRRASEGSLRELAQFTQGTRILSPHILCYLTRILMNPDMTDRFQRYNGAKLSFLLCFPRRTSVASSSDSTMINKRRAGSKKELHAIRG